MSLSKDRIWAKTGGRWGGIGKQHHIRALGGGYEGQSQNVSAWSTLGVYRKSLLRTPHHVPSQTSTLSTPTSSFFSHHPSILLFVFLLDKEQASPGGLRLFLTFTSLVRYLSIRLSLSLSLSRAHVLSLVSLQVSLPLLHSSPPAHGPESSFVYFSYPRPPHSSQFCLFWSHQDQRRWDEKKEVRIEGR